MYACMQWVINLRQRATLLSVESLGEQFLFLCEIYLSTHCEMLVIKPVQAFSNWTTHSPLSLFLSLFLRSQWIMLTLKPINEHRSSCKFSKKSNKQILSFKSYSLFHNPRGMLLNLNAATSRFKYFWAMETCLVYCKRFRLTFNFYTLGIRSTLPLP